jgi:hypothetical protein
VWVFVFIYNNQEVEIGPYTNEYDAKLTFQWRYHYWPENAKSIRPFKDA